ncbi:hypothetical protein [Parasedimentitalea psychrophila]|uniref:Uncharacterized protein n=1 Tax=Parasedimentitalea psychrophila TaxID=2997337 RepID=A0A9Y2KXW7_9RHOB|nr:hypothetical protein [Parasedimentitalea psychrophila]WIY24489.1 hypothetical protein QPJ95_18340 [Parasedimentitalea psychrophila]
MQDAINPSFEDRVLAQVELLGAGLPLEAFDVCFSASGLMFANDVLFASSAEEGRKKQEPFISAATSIHGLITDLRIHVASETCVFRNKSSFGTGVGATHQIDGLCWQKWIDGRISEERYYDGRLMCKMIADGILSAPEELKPSG